MADAVDIQRELQVLEAELKRLEAEYNMFFAGRLPRPPWETRSRVETLIKRWDRGHIQGSAERFRFASLQARYQAFVDLWDRALRAKEEGRPGPLAHKLAEVEAQKKRRVDRRVLHVASFADPIKEMDKLQTLYDSVMKARRAGGHEVVPFHRFAALVKDQVSKLRDQGHNEVTFRVTEKDGQVALSAKGDKARDEGKKKAPDRR